MASNEIKVGEREVKLIFNNGFLFSTVSCNNIIIIVVQTEKCNQSKWLQGKWNPIKSKKFLFDYSSNVSTPTFSSAGTEFLQNNN